MPVGYRNLNNPCLRCQGKKPKDCDNYNGPHLVTHRKDKCAVCGAKLKECDDATTNSKTSKG